MSGCVVSLLSYVFLWASLVGIPVDAQRLDSQPELLVTVNMTNMLGYVLAPMLSIQLLDEVSNDGSFGWVVRNGLDSRTFLSFVPSPSAVIQGSCDIVTIRFNGSFAVIWGGPATGDSNIALSALTVTYDGVLTSVSHPEIGIFDDGIAEIYAVNSTEGSHTLIISASECQSASLNISSVQILTTDSGASSPSGSSSASASMRGSSSSSVASSSTHSLSEHSTSSSAAVTSPTNVRLASSDKRNIAGPIAGGVVGGLALLSLILVACFWRRRHRVNDEKTEMDLNAVPHDTGVNAFDASHATGGGIAEASVAPAFIGSAQPRESQLGPESSQRLYKTSDLAPIPPSASFGRSFNPLSSMSSSSPTTAPHLITHHTRPSTPATLSGDAPDLRSFLDLSGGDHSLPLSDAASSVGSTRAHNPDVKAPLPMPTRLEWPEQRPSRSPHASIMSEPTTSAGEVSQPEIQTQFHALWGEIHRLKAQATRQGGGSELRGERPPDYRPV